VDIMAASHNLLDVSRTLHAFVGLRSPQTNAMLPLQIGGVAKNSLHNRGSGWLIVRSGRVRLNQHGPRGNRPATAAVSVATRAPTSSTWNCGPVRNWGLIGALSYHGNKAPSGAFSF